MLEDVFLCLESLPFSFSPMSLGGFLLVGVKDLSVLARRVRGSRRDLRFSPIYKLYVHI